MLIAIIGENCVGKSTLANKINEKLGAKIYSGKDYLRMKKDPSAAVETFKATLKAAVDGDDIKFVLRVAEEDTGMVIGHHGKIAKAIRSIMKAAANTCGKRVTVEIE